MSKTDLRARPIYHHKRDSIEAHLTIVMAALAVSNWLERQTGWSIKKLVTTLRHHAASPSRPATTSSTPEHPSTPTPEPPSMPSRTQPLDTKLSQVRFQDRFLVRRRRLRRRLASPARDTWPGPRLVRATRPDPRAAGSDPGPHHDDPGTGAGDPTVGETARRRRDQTVLGRLRHHRCVQPADAPVADRRPAGSGGRGGLGETPAPQQAPGADRGADRPVQRPPRLLGADVSGIDRPTNRSHRRPDRADRGGDRALSFLL